MKAKNYILLMICLNVLCMYITIFSATKTAGMSSDVIWILFFALLTGGVIALCLFSLAIRAMQNKKKGFHLVCVIVVWLAAVAFTSQYIDSFGMFFLVTGFALCLEVGMLGYIKIMVGKRK